MLNLISARACWKEISQARITGVMKSTGTAYVIGRNGRHEETRTPDLYRVKVEDHRPDTHVKGVINRRGRLKPAQLALFATNLLPTLPFYMWAQG
jgi:hypothetical protein